MSLIYNLIYKRIKFASHEKKTLVRTLIDTKCKFKMTNWHWCMVCSFKQTFPHFVIEKINTQKYEAIPRGIFGCKFIWFLKVH